MATLAVLWLIDTKRPSAWVAALAALYLYDGVIDAVRTRGGFQSAPTVLDNVGIIIKELMPVFACGIATVWYQRQRPASLTRV